MPRGRKPKTKINRKELRKKLEEDLAKGDVTKKRVSKKKFNVVNDLIIKAVESGDVNTWFNHISEFIVFFVKKNGGEMGRGINVSRSEQYKGTASASAYFKDVFYSIFISFLPHNGYNIYLSKLVDGEFTEPIKLCYNKNIEEYNIKEVL